jgi:hypothetical protein
MARAPLEAGVHDRGDDTIGSRGSPRSQSGGVVTPRGGTL